MRARPDLRIDPGLSVCQPLIVRYQIEVKRGHSALYWFFTWPFYMVWAIFVIAFWMFWLFWQMTVLVYKIIAWGVAFIVAWWASQKAQDR